MNETSDKTRFLVRHDYGMGNMLWWVRARSAREILETFAEVDVVDDASTRETAESWNLPTVDIDASTLPNGLDDLRAQRIAQRDRPGFGALADREILYLKRDRDEDGGPEVYLMEIEADGRRTRQVVLSGDGTAAKSTPDDWAFNPPVVDLFDPELVTMEIDRDEFEAAWQRARPMADDES